jgi:hypothetical protein
VSAKASAAPPRAPVSMGPQAAPNPGAASRTPAHGLDVGAYLHRASTPSRLRLILYGTWAVAAMLFLVGWGALREASQAMKTVGTDAAPSILAAEEISSALADLDANAGNYLLGTKFHQAASTQTFERQRGVVTTRLVDAAKNITYPAERPPVDTMFDSLGRYLELIAEMRYRKDTGDANGALATYEAASEIMHQRMLPAADTLDTVNYDILKREYEAQQRNSLGALVLASLVVAALLAFLVGSQVFLARRMRRIFNLPLVAATLVSALFGVYLVTRIAVAREDLRVAKEDAFESIRALWQARALAYDANGDETRYLLDRSRAVASEQAYRDKVKKLATVAEPDEGLLFAKEVPPRYQGLFAAELRNVTFPGERDAAVKMIRAFGVYDKVDGKIRALEQASRHADAVELCIGTSPDQSNDAFTHFDDALKAVIEINRKEFDETIVSGSGALDTALYALPVAALLIAALALLGVRARLREYAA